jgi:hypothetical protein
MKLDKETADRMEKRGWSLAGALGDPAYPARQNCRWTDQEDRVLRQGYDFHCKRHARSLAWLLKRAAARHYRSVDAIRSRLEHLKLIDPQGCDYKSLYKKARTALEAIQHGSYNVNQCRKIAEARLKQPEALTAELLERLFAPTLASTIERHVTDAMLYGESVLSFKPGAVFYVPEEPIKKGDHVSVPVGNGRRNAGARVLTTSTRFGGIYGHTVRTADVVMDDTGEVREYDTKRLKKI